MDSKGLSLWVVYWRFLFGTCGVVCVYVLFSRWFGVNQPETKLYDNYYSWCPRRACTKEKTENPEIDVAHAFTPSLSTPHDHFLTWKHTAKLHIVFQMQIFQKSVRLNRPLLYILCINKELYLYF